MEEIASSGGVGGTRERVMGKMWDLEQELDQPMDEEAGKLRNMYREKKTSYLLIARLAFQSLGVVFGDLGTSPLYVFYCTFPSGVAEPDEIVGALSVIIYSLTLIALFKYILVVLRANDNGQGGTFALYSLLCRHAKIKTIPNQHRTDEELTTYIRHTFDEKSLPAKVKRWLEAHAYKKTILLVLVLIGTSMVIGDGILTPAISVISAAGGLKVDHPNISNDVVVLVAVVILLGLFSMQHYGMDKVGWLFAPIVFIWFILIGSIGALNIWKYDSGALKAFSPIYVYRFLSRGHSSWTSLGGIMLSITGIEALFADLCYFPVLAVQIAFSLIVFPCLLLAYTGQAAYLMKNKHHVVDAFYRSVPDCLYWPVFVIATASAIISSQATISASFSIIKQANAHGCFPRIKVVHTSEKFPGQIYIPDINWVLMILCIAVTAGFKNQIQIGNAYGTAVVIDMFVTTLLMIFIMLMVWRSHWVLVAAFVILSLLVESPYFFAILFKVDQGGWVPLVIAATFLVIMYIWHYGTIKRYEFEMHSKVSMAWILGLGPSLGLVRVPGVGLVYTELASGVPRIFSHLITNLPAIHSILVLVCVKYLPVYTVPIEERFLVKRIGPKNIHMFRCVARYGYKDLHRKDDDFEKMLFDRLSDFVRLECMMEVSSDSDICSLDSVDLEIVHEDDTIVSTIEVLKHSSSTESLSSTTQKRKDLFRSSHRRENGDDTIVSTIEMLKHSSSTESLSTTFRRRKDLFRSSHRRTSRSQTMEDELDFLIKCKDVGVVHILGNTVVRAQKGSGLLKRIAVDYIYSFLRRLCRENSVIFNVPHESLLNVGQVFSV